MAKQEKTAAELYREERKARIAKAAKKNAKKSHNVTISKGTQKAIAVLLVIALVAGIVGFSISNSGMLERGDVALKIGDTEVTKAEYSYYYNSIFSNYFNNSYYYDYYYGSGYGAMYTGYDYSVSPDTQSYSGEIEGVDNPMWTDYFKQSALESLKYVKGAVAYAAENGIELGEEDLAEVDETIESIETAADESNYSTAAYLRAYYGKAMTLDMLRKICEEQSLTNKVQEVVTAEYAEAYSKDEVENTFKEDLETYGAVSLRSYVIEAETVTVEAESEDEEDTEEVTDETMADAKAEAEAFAAAVTDEASFKTVAAQYEKEAGTETYAEFETDDSLTLSEDVTYEDLYYDSYDEDLCTWAFNEKTEKNETYILESDGEGYTVYMMVDPVHHAPDELTYDVRHILLKFTESEDETEETEETEEETEEVKAEMLDTSKYEDVVIDIDVDLENTTEPALYNKIQDILIKYLDGDRTEDYFAELAAEYTEDSNGEDGGIYEDVTLGYMVSEFENWAIEDGRQYGDVGIVETTYGYHIMYYIGSEVTTWEDTIRNDLASAEYETFISELEEGENVAISGEDEEVLLSVEEFTVSLAKTQIRNINSSSSSY